MPSVPARSPSTSHLAIMALVVLGAVFVPLGVVMAAGDTTVAVQPSTATIDPDANTTFEIVVTEVHNGVDAYNVTVRVIDPSMASIESVDLRGDPGLQEVRYDDDRSRVTVLAALTDLNETEPLTLFSLTVRGKVEGRTTLESTVSSLGDEDGKEYDVTATEPASLVVGSPPSTTTSPPPTTTSPPPTTTTKPSPTTTSPSPTTDDSPGGSDDAGSTDTQSPTDVRTTTRPSTDVRGSPTTITRTSSPAAPVTTTVPPLTTTSPSSPSDATGTSRTTVSESRPTTDTLPERTSGSETSIQPASPPGNSGWLGSRPVLLLAVVLALGIGIVILGVRRRRS